jgi:hypothetical protein
MHYLCDTIIKEKDMEKISSERLEKMLEQFMHENPYGDTRDLAEWFYNKGYKEGNDDAHKKMIFGK